MTLADLIEAQQEALTARWLEAVRPLAPRPGLTREDLVDSLPLFFEELVRALRSLEDPSVRSALPERSPVAEVHGRQRFALGYAASAVAREYPLLQEALLRAAEEQGVPVRAAESILLARCMGTATAEALAHFTTEHERALRKTSADSHARRVIAENELMGVQEAEVRARESEARLRLVLDTLPHAIHFVDAQERYVLNNDAYRTWFGVEPEAIRGRTVRAVVGEENYAALKPFIDRALAGEGGEYERPFVFRGGRRGHVHGHFTPYRAPDGRVLGYVALVQDITERYRLTAELQAARAALEAERARLHGLFESAPAIVATLRGPEHVFEMANPLYLRAVAGGRPLLGLPVAQALPEVVAQGFVALLDGVYRSGEPYVGREVPLRLDRHGDGRLEDTWWTFVYQPTRDAAGAVEGVAAFGFEVTEHVRARREAEALAARLEATLAERQQLQSALAHSEARLRETLRATGAGTLDLDVATGAMQFDAQMRAITGLPPEGPLPLDAALGQVHPEDRPAVEALFQRALEEGRPFVTEHRIAPRTPGEPERWISTRGAALFGPEGRAVRFLGTAVDITEQKRAEAARRESEQQLHSVLDAIPALVAFIDPQHRYRFGNAAYGRWFGVDTKSLPGRSVGAVIGEESYARIRPFIERALAGEEVRYESPFVFGGGREGVLQAAYVPQRAADGRVVGYVAIAWDVSAERSAEAALRQRADFERQLIGIVSHDLRNPLQVIQLSTATLLRRAGLDDRQAAIIGRIGSTAERMTRMIRDLLDFTRARMGGGIALEPRALDLHALARQVVDEVQLAHPERQVQVLAQGDAQGRWDADRLAQLLGNLLTNALAYSPPHTPVQVATRGLDGDVLLEVHNAGAPIPPEQLQRLFRPFERGENSATGTGRSIGLGLFIVDALVRAHGGRIEVRSTQEAGTTFTVRLPRG